MKRLNCLAAAATLAACVWAAEPPKKPLVAPTPPMGWNSYDAYDCTINEQDFRANVDVLAKELKEYGWQYAVIDFLWYNPALGSPDDLANRKGNPDLRVDSHGRPLDRLDMDQNGRLLPSVNRFPSAANGAGFKPIADYVHGKGLKFGIHIMRGIPRQAYFQSLAVLGTKYTARDAANPRDTCPWLNYMYGVNPTKPAGQAYYDSLLKLYAGWGVDFIKVDDISAAVYHAGEIEMIRKAIDRCGRPIVLSLSPGETPLGRARHVCRYANMWRLSDDFWDNWKSLAHNFDLLNAWSGWRAPDVWPDGDMLPIGHISLHGHPVGPDRMSEFTWPEHYTLMSLWSIVRSPLMIGADLVSSPQQSLAFLKNKEVLAVNQHSENNRQVRKGEHDAVWIADVPGSADKYLALFNLTTEKRKVTFHFEDEMARGEYALRDLWAHQDLGVFGDDFEAQLDPHGAGLYRITRRK